MGRGLKMIAEIYGGLSFTRDGKTTKYIYDYVNEELVEESQFTKEQQEASERKKAEKIKAIFEKEKNQQKLF
jgi:hypothetical protein